MEFINNNKETIVAWYEKQARKENISLNPIYDTAKCAKTSMVQEKHIKEIEDELLCAIGEAKLVKVVPLLRPRTCFWNCVKMDKILNKKAKKVNTVLGYNITACHCGKLYMMELHALLKDNATGDYIDLTTDFCSETEKWFIPIEEDCSSLKNRVNTINALGGGFYYSCSHTCNRIRWTQSEDILTGNLERLDDIIELAQTDKITIL